MKHTSESMIREEQITFMGEEIPFTEKFPAQEFLTDYSGIEVALIKPAPFNNEEYSAWIEAAYEGTFETWFEIGKRMPVVTFPKKEKILIKTLKTRRISYAMETQIFAFRITGISRAMTHQIVRHRKAVFGQQSLRVADATANPIRLPEFDQTNDKQRELIESAKDVLTRTKSLYWEMIKSGIPREQARNILPIGTTTTINASFPLGALIEYFKARNSGIAQNEHTYIANQMEEQIKSKQPKFYDIIESLS